MKRTIAVGIVAVMTAAGLSGCQQKDQHVSNQPVPSVSVAQDPRPSGPPADAPQSYEEAIAVARPLLLQPADYPGEGWQPGGEVKTDDFVQVICGVPTEPVPPAGVLTKQVRHGETTLVVQTIRPVGAAQARTTIDELGKALTTCTRDKRPVSTEEQGTFEMQKLALADSEAVAYRQHRTDKGKALHSYVVMVEHKGALVAFATLSSSADAPIDFLDHLVKQVKTK